MFGPACAMALSQVWLSRGPVSAFILFLGPAPPHRINARKNRAGPPPPAPRQCNPERIVPLSPALDRQEKRGGGPTLGKHRRRPPNPESGWHPFLSLNPQPLQWALSRLRGTCCEKLSKLRTGPLIASGSCRAGVLKSHPNWSEPIGYALNRREYFRDARRASPKAPANRTG